MSWIIVRSNGKVEQAWANNQSAWSSFLKGFVRDVDWHNLPMTVSKPRQFKSAGEAHWYLDKRAEKLRFRNQLGQDLSSWVYKVKEYEDVVHQQTEEG